MKLTNKQIIEEIHPSLEKFSKMKLSGVLVEDIMLLARNLNRFKSYSQDVFTARDIIFTKYSEKGEDGKPIVKNGVFKMTDEYSAQIEMKELLEKTVEVEVEKIDSSIFDSVDGLSVEIVSGLMPILEENG